MMYNASIQRIGDRPGSGIQVWLARRIVRKFLKFGRQSDLKVLEIGTGVGRIAHEVLGLGHSYVGVEPTQSLRSAAFNRLKAFDGEFQILDSRLPTIENLEGMEFSHVLAVHVFEHAESPAAAHSWLSAMASRVETDGVILIVCPNILDFRQYFYDADWTHVWESTTSRIASLGEELGLEIVEERDLRGTFSNLLAKSILATCSKLIPTGPLNTLFMKYFGLRNFATGIQTAFFWRISWVVFRRN